MPQKFLDFIPKANGAARDWYVYEIAHADIQGAAIGMTAPQILAYKAFCQSQIDDLDAMTAAQAEVAAVSARIKINSPINKKGIRAAVKKAKENTAYTPAGGALFKIVDTHTTLDFEFFTPILECFVFTGYVRMKFAFHGLDAMNVYCRLKGTTTWVKIASVTHSPFDDHRPIFQPNLPPVAQLTSEAREYMIIGVVENEEVGNASAIHPVVFGG